MAGAVTPERQTRVKKRVITSCLECYRRKQKCDRMKPCNFCVARGVPEICRYTSNSVPRQSPRGTVSSQEEHISSSFVTLENSQNCTIPASSSHLLDQVGYSLASRRSELECVGEYGSETTLRSSNGQQLITINNADVYLRLLARLPSEQVVDGLIDAHFSSENWSFPVLDEHYFRRLHGQFRCHLGKKDLSEKVIRLPLTLATFPALLFSVLSVTLQFVTPNTVQAFGLDLSTLLQCNQMSQWYIDTGQEIIRLFKLQKPTTTSIEFHLMKMAWLKNCGRGVESWQCLGIALREAQELDLHQIQDGTIQGPGVEVSDTLSRLWELEHQKRVWARIFIMDSHMAIALGRPRGINREDCSTSAPLDCDFPPEPSQTVPMSTKHSVQPPNAFSSVIFSIALGHKYHDLMSIRSSKLDLKDYKRVNDLHNDVESLLTELPPALRPSFSDTHWDAQMPHLPALRLRLLTTANIFLLALHRPYVSTRTASRLAAKEAAFAILQTQQELFMAVPQAQHKLYGYSFYTIDAGIFLAATSLKYSALDTDANSRVLQALQQAIFRLDCMKERSVIARTGEVVFQRCYDVIEAQISSSWSTASDFDIENVRQALDLDVMNFLQELDSHIPDQASHELMSLLTKPPTSVGSSAAAVLPLKLASQHYSGIPASDLSVSNDSLYQNSETDM